MQQKRLAAGLVAAFAAYVQADSDVTQLTKDTFADFVKANDLVLAECKCLFLENPAVLGSIADLVLLLQSSLPGAATARPLPPSTRRLLPRSRRRTSSSPRLTALKRPTCARSMVLRVTLPSRSSVALRTSAPTVASARLLRKNLPPHLPRVSCFESASDCFVWVQNS
jgi:hypothetical protein